MNNRTGILPSLKGYSRQGRISHDDLLLVEKVDKKLNKFVRKNRLAKDTDPKVFSFISKYIDLTENKDFLTAPSTHFNIEKLPKNNYNNIVNLKKINDVRHINKFFEEVNTKLGHGDLFVSCVETFTARRKRKGINNIPVVRKIYFGLEFIFLRVFPKINGFKQLYFLSTKGKNRLLSKAEALGRLVSCGFEIVDFKSIDGILYMVSKKVGKPAFDSNPSYGPLYKMPRIGKGGKIIGVYKLRTMHPYAEYLHDYILRKNGYAHTGKPADDFRLAPWAKIVRKYYIDELPQLINVLKGELKLVGIRPVSQRFFQDIPEDLQKLRSEQKPGCIPPYVALNRHCSVACVLEAEREYLKEKKRNPYFTDTKYFFMAVFNILFRKKRSA